jgi:hypothetical protein
MTLTGQRIEPSWSSGLLESMNMTRFWLAAPAIFALTIGGALAQTTDTTISTKTQTTLPVPAISGYSATETQKTIDSNGTTTNKTQTYNSGSGSTNSSATTSTTTPGGTQTNTTTKEQTATPYGSTTTKSTTTTTE